MKQIFTILLSFIAAITLVAQSPKKAVIEHFTQASCPPCAGTNPIIHPIMEAYKSKIVRVTHQVSWPGYDPMNKDNPGDVSTRVNYYGINGVPDSKINGKDFGTSIETITAANIIAESNGTSPYEITIAPTINPNLNEAEIKVTVTLTGTFGGNPVLYVAVNEKVISWNSPPGSNGEIEFHHVMKKYLPNASGTNISSLSKTGESLTFSFPYTFNNIYDLDKLETVVFIQNALNKVNYQGESADMLITKFNGVDAALRSGVPSNQSTTAKFCGTKLSPVVNIINAGNEPIKTIKFSSRINAGQIIEYTYTSTIALDYLSHRDIVIPNIPMNGLYPTGNVIEVKVVEVNGKSDDQLVNNKLFIPFDPSPQTTISSSIEIKPRTRPDLITFSVTDDLGKTILTGGPFTSTTAVKFPLAFEKDRCYAIQINNDHTGFNATTKIFNDQNVSVYSVHSLTQGTILDYVTTSSFITSTKDVFVSDIKIQPNPITDHATIEFQSESNQALGIQILDIKGSVILSQQKSVSQGQNKLALDLSTVSPGLYFMQMKQGTKMTSKKIIIE